MNESSDLISEKSKPLRLESLDIVRGIAIAMMVFTHYFVYSVNFSSIHNKLLLGPQIIASYISVPLFYFIVGYTLVISTNDKIRRGYSREQLMKYIIARASIIYVLGLVLNIYEVGFGHVWYWETLQMISIGYVFTYFLLPRSIMTRTGVAAVSLFIAFMLAPFYAMYVYKGIWSFPEFLFGVLFSGDDPFFPWIAYFILGSIIAEIKITRKMVMRILPPFIILSFISVIAAGYIPITKYPASLTYNVICITVTLFIFIIIFWLTDIKKTGISLFYPFKIFGMFPLTIFILHIIIGMQLIKWVSISGSLDIVEFSGLYILTFVVITGIGYLWEKGGFKYSIDWFLKFISYKVLGKPTAKT